MPRLFLFKFAIALLVASSLSACVATHDPYAHYSPEERAKLMADRELRWQQQAQQRQELRQRDTLASETFAHHVRSGDTRPLEGIMSRGYDVYEGRWIIHQDPYTQRQRYRYDKGTYQSNAQPGIPLQSNNGVYRGDFLYFQDPPGNNTLPKATFVMIGSFTRHDGVQDTGIYVAEDSYATLPLHFLKATPAYLERIEQRYQRQVAHYKEEQLRLARESEESMFNFGQLLALGLGGLMLASSDIPGADRLDIGTALFKDVMSQGQSDALASLTREKAGSYMNSTLATASRVNASTGVAGAMASGRSGATGLASPGQNTSYSFTCPSGQSSTVSISYKTPSCLAAKQEMTRIYACNMVDDFNKIQGLCAGACGTPQCTE